MEAGVGPKAVAWALVCVLACGFCYSIGWQSGSADATEDASARLRAMTAALDDIYLRADENARAAADVGGG